MDHGILSVVPAVLAIALAIWTRNVIVSLFGAVALAGIIHMGGNPVDGLIHALGREATDPDGKAYISGLAGAIADYDHAKTMLFTVLIGAMVGVIGKSGATRSLVEGLAARAKSPQSVQILSWISGLVVFFDDYANCMIVGSAMGPLCDRYKITRAKLAYIVDSTAAPVASLALVSTWVGFEVGVVDEGLQNALSDGLIESKIQAYGFFVQGWPYRFYPILAFLFVGMIAITGRDFGPMLADRSKAGDEDDEEEEEHDDLAPYWVAIVPVATLILVTLAVLYQTGSAELPPGAKLFEVLANADGYGAIVQGSFCALFLACLFVLATRSMNLKETTEAALGGMKIMFEALIILLLAWSLSSAMKELGAPAYLVKVLGPTLPAWSLPTVTFLVGSAISFAVGSSYATMGIMMPMVVPLAFKLSPGGDMTIPLAASGSVLAGACFGDHCSPISDTTVLSAIGSGSELLDHVRTQLPYAVTIGIISVVCGTFPAAFGINPWLCLVGGMAAGYAALRYLGKSESTVDSRQSTEKARESPADA
jgi:Na+/H+ antiporter NhaC